MSALTLALVVMLTSLVAVQSRDHWAVLIAGSKGYFNYRHQADVCHAYHLLVKKGFDPSKIITMLYDDVANSTMNPYKGRLYNYPWHSLDAAVDVYDGCKKDYVGADVTPEKFLAVLMGDMNTAGGKVLESTADDHVFINFVDHGGVGIIAFPEAEEVLHANKLVQTLKQMHEKGLYGKLTFYLETCESGSMFEGLLPAELPVYAVTAANAHESSWGTYCGAESKVAGRSLGTCLGDLFSVNWMTNSEGVHIMDETLEQQFLIVKNLTNKSHVMQYGQVSSFGSLPVDDFQGSAADNQRPVPQLVEETMVGRGSIDSRDVKLQMLYENYVKDKTRQSGKLLASEIQSHVDVRDRSLNIAALVLGSDRLAHELVDAPVTHGPIDWQYAACHEAVVHRFGATCGWSEAALKISKVLYSLCTRTSGNVSPINVSVEKACAATTSEIVV